jgi:hypothetical protein
MSRFLMFLPALVLAGPWCVLEALGTRPAVAVITGMLPAGWGPEAVLFGVLYVGSWLVAITLGPPAVLTGVLGFAFRRRRAAPVRPRNR